MNLSPDQPPAEPQPLPSDYLRCLYSEPWYLRYPLSSWLALILAATVTVAPWTAVIVLEKYAIAGDLVLNILTFLAYVVIVVTLFAIMWFFETGVLTSIMIGFVAWCHLVSIGLGLLVGIAGGEYDSPNFVLPLVFPCIALPVAVIYGAWLGSRRERGF